MKRKDPTGHPCPSCGSSDAVKIQDNGWAKCFSCSKNYSPTQVHETILSGKSLMTNTPIPVKERPTSISPLSDVIRPWPKRGLTSDTLKRYRVGVGNEGADYESISPIFDTDNSHIANKVRRAGKGFNIEHTGNLSSAGLFGRQAFPPGSAKAITVTEGYEDAMSAYQLLGSKYPCVSVHSASTAERDVRKDFEYLNSFETIVFAFDNDEAGRKAAKACASVGFPLGKVKVLTFRKHKDANDYLLAKEADTFTKEWWQAPAYKPDGLKLGRDMWDEIINRKDSFTTPYPWDGLNKLTFGIRLSELVVLTADTGVGKTSVLKHIEHLLLTNEDVKEKNYGVGFLHLEEPNGDTALGLLSIHNSQPYHLPTTDRPEADLRKAYTELLENDRVVIWDHFGSNSVDAVLDKVRHMVALGCKYIVLDHLSIVVSDQSGDERKQLDEITTKLKTLTMELDIAVLAVIHTNRQGQIRGTAGVEQLANIVLRLERDKTDPNEWRRNVTKITVEKNRFSGYTGPACYLWYNKDTARLIELDDAEALTYENGGHLNDDQVGF
jgi:twinkle protein